MTATTGASKGASNATSRVEPMLVLVATIATIVVNTLPNALQLRGETTGSISAKSPTLITPAGYAFSIWSVIYLALLGFAVFQLLPAQRGDRLLARLRRPYLLSCVLNSAWIFIWHYELITLSAAVIASLLSSLLFCYVQLDSARDRGTRVFRALVVAPFSLYAAWVTVATIVNVAAALVAVGWQGGPLAPATWSVVMILVAFGLALVVAWPHRDWIYPAVVAWAVSAIAVRQAELAAIRWTAQVVAALLLVAVIATVVRRSQVATTSQKS